MATFNAYYSKRTDIFYAKHKNVLYRFSAFQFKQSTKTKKEINIEWVESTYMDIEKMSQNWVKATQAQIDEYSLNEKFKEMIHKLTKIGALKE